MRWQATDLELLLGYPTLPDLTHEFNMPSSPFQLRYTIVLSLYLCLAFVGLAVAKEGEGRSLDIYWIDVEGGAATLMVTPAGESILIDTGNPGFRDPNRIVTVAGQVAGLKKIDHLVTTHYHRDHYGGAALLAKLIPVGKVYDNGRFENMPNDPGTEYFNFPCEQRIVLEPGDCLDLKSTSGPAVSIQCLVARKQFVTATTEHSDNQQLCSQCQPKDRDGSDNANSIVLLTSFGDFRFFDGGDLTWNQEMRLVCPNNLVGQVDVYQVTHHGLDSSNNPVVLQSLEPTIAVMNNGHTKGCLPDVFANLMNTKSIEAIYQVHKNLRPDGSVNNVADRRIANLEDKETCQGNYIHLSVSEDASEYSIHIPANNLSESFRTTPK